MTEPVSSGATAAIYKLSIYLGGATMASIVVMAMMAPKTFREWCAALISTVVCSLGLGSYVLVNYFPLFLEFANIANAMFAGGIYFVCGLPGWCAVSIIFNTQRLLISKNAFDAAKEIKRNWEEK